MGPRRFFYFFPHQKTKQNKSNREPTRWLCSCCSSCSFHRIGSGCYWFPCLPVRFRTMCVVSFRMFVRFTGFYRVFRFVQGFPEFNWVLLRVSIVFTEFYWVLPGFTEFYWVLLSYTELYRVLPSFTEFYRVLPGFTGFYRVLPDFYRVLPGFTYWGQGELLRRVGSLCGSCRWWEWPRRRGGTRGPAPWRSCFGDQKGKEEREREEVVKRLDAELSNTIVRNQFRPISTEDVPVEGIPRRRLWFSKFNTVLNIQYGACSDLIHERQSSIRLSCQHWMNSGTCVLWLYGNSSTLLPISLAISSLLRRTDMLTR